MQKWAKYSLSVFVIVACVFLVGFVLTTADAQQNECVGPAKEPVESPAYIYNTSASPNPADTNIEIFLQGFLSGYTGICVGEEPGECHASSYTERATDATATIVSGGGTGWLGETIPLDINVGGQVGTDDCGQAIYALSGYEGNRTFNTAGLAEGTYEIGIRVEDNRGSFNQRPLSFTVDHGEDDPGDPGDPGGATYTLTVSAETVDVDGDLGGAGWITASGIDCGTNNISGHNDCTETYNEGEVVNLSRTLRNPGTDTFIGWGGGCTSGTVVMDGDKTCSGTFNMLPGGGQQAPNNNQCVVRGAAWDNDNLSESVLVGAYVGGQLVKTGFADGYNPNCNDPGVGDDLCRYSIQLGPNDIPYGQNVQVTTRAEDINTFEISTLGTQTINCEETTGTIVVSSNLSTTWSIDGPDDQPDQNTPSLGETYIDVGEGIYTVDAASKPGHTVEITQCNADPCSQTLNGGDTINFNIEYQAVGGSPTLTLDPPARTIDEGNNAHFIAWYDPDGPSGPQPQQSVASGASWSSSNPSVGSYVGNFTMGGLWQARYAGNNSGTTIVSASYNGLDATATLNVNSAGGPDFTCNISPASRTVAQGGSVDYNVVSAPINGFSGTVAFSASNLPSASSASFAPSSVGIPPAGNSDLTFSAGASTLPGAYTFNVTCESGGISHTVPVGVTVTGGGLTHAECQSNSCVQVPGGGPDRCNLDADCSGGGGNVRTVCDSVNGACVNEDGPGASTCSNDADCPGGSSGPTHLECQGSVCLVVGGVGPDECADAGNACGLPECSDGLDNDGDGNVDWPDDPECSGPDDDDEANAPVPASCDFDASPTVISRGGSSTLAWDCNGPVTSCVVTDGDGNAVASGGADGSTSVSPVETTDYTLTCNAVPSSITEEVRIRVLQISEEPPR